LHSAVVPLHRAGPSIEPELLTILAGACRSEERLAFRYADQQGKPSQRDVEPHGLVHAGSRWYLVAWDLQREDWRTFRVDRVAGRPSTGKRFVPRPVPHGDVGKYVARSIAREVYTYQARVVLLAPLEKVAQQLSPLAAQLTRIDAEHCLLEAGGHSLASLGWYLTLLGVEFEVLGPPELVDSVRELGERLQRAGSRAAETRRFPLDPAVT
jgi:predicted DNA-binding transcriptional regulator YafY